MTLSLIFISALTLLAILNPFGNVAIFVAIAEELEEKDKIKLLNTVVFTGFCITLIFSLIGQFLMTTFYHIGMNELKMGGGLILIVIATKNLVFPTAMKDAKNVNLTIDDYLKQAIIPIAFPMLVGPGVLTTTLIIKGQHGTLINLGAIILAFIIIYITYRIGTFIEKILGKLVLYILSRVMQIFILAIGFSIFFHGLVETLKIYGIMK